MAKITINNILASFASTTSINARFQQVEDEFNDKVLYRDNPVGEVNNMSNDLDMNNQDIINVGTLFATDIDFPDLLAQVGYAEEWASKSEDSLVSTDAGGNGVDEYSALHWAAKTAADAIVTNADVVSTNADVVITNDDVVSTNADVVRVLNKYTEFDDRYLGRHAANPTTLNDGITALDASHDGIEFWDETLKVRKTWNGGTLTWGLTSTSVATNAVDVNIADAGGQYTGTDVEAALQEVGKSAIQVLTNKVTTDLVQDGTATGTAIKDEDNLISDSATHLATQQSIKAYIDGEKSTYPTTSGEDIIVSSVPAWVQKITILFSEVSMQNGLENIYLQLGISSGMETTNYVSSTSEISGLNASNLASSTAVFIVAFSLASADEFTGVATLTLMDSTANKWLYDINAMSNAGVTFHGSGQKSLASVLTQFQVSTSGALNDFDNGSFKVIYN